MTPLAFASIKGKVDVGRFLIKKGADVHAQDNKGWAPLHVTSGHGHLEMVRHPNQRLSNFFTDVDVPLPAVLTPTRAGLEKEAKTTHSPYPFTIPPAFLDTSEQEEEEVERDIEEQGDDWEQESEMPGPLAQSTLSLLLQPPDAPKKPKKGKELAVEMRKSSRVSKLSDIKK